MPDLAERIELTWSLVDGNRQQKILKRLNGVLRINGFLKVERAPIKIVLNSCRAKLRNRVLVLGEIATEYLGDGCKKKYIETKEPLPPLTTDNAPGIFALMTILEVDDEVFDKMVSSYESISADTAQSQSEEEKDVPIEDIEVSPTMHEDDNYMEEMKYQDTYIGFIQEANRFYNYWPIYEYQNGQCYEIEDKSGDFPSYGNINIYGDRRVLDSSIADQEVYVMTFSADDLEDNFRYDGELNATEFKLSLAMLQAQHKIKRLHDIGIYPVVHPETESEKFISGDIIIREAADEKDPALIQFGNMLYGPYNVSIKNHKHYIHVTEPKYHIIEAYTPKQGTIQSNYLKIPVDRDGRLVTFNVYAEKDFQKRQYDLISDEQLIEEFYEALKNNKLIDKESPTIPEILSALNHEENTIFPAETEYQEINHRRVERIKTLLENEQFRNQAYEDVTKIFAKLFATEGNSETFHTMMEDILDDPILSSKIQSFDIVRQNVSEKQSELKELSAKITATQQTATEEQTEEVRKLRQELQDRDKKLESYASTQQWLQDAQKAKEERNFYRRSCEEARAEFDRVVTNINSTLENVSARAASIAFEPMLSNKLMEAAAKWQNETLENEYEKVAKCACEFETEPISVEALNEYICSAVKRYRPGYEDNDILNIVINLVQNFLTVFSGEPGTGKTSICNIIAHILGLSKIEKEIGAENGIFTGRYVPISVERGWTSKRDFIGYYNPLTQRVEKANAQLYDGLRVISAEGDHSAFPFVVLLDEANLSPMEYYWADFMNICDRSSKSSHITLGDKYQFNVPSTCRFVATINNDHTTEVLSPRLIDRSAVIVLPVVPYQTVEDEGLEDDSFVKIVSWNDLQSAYDVATIGELARVPKEIFENQVSPCLKKLGISVNPRTERAIKRFCNVAQSIFKADKNGTDPSIIALDYSIAQHLLTKVNGSGEEYRAYLEELKSICAKSTVNLTHCADVIGRILEKGDSSLRYYQFF